MSISVIFIHCSGLLKDFRGEGDDPDVAQEFDLKESPSQRTRPSSYSEQGESAPSTLKPSVKRQYHSSFRASSPPSSPDISPATPRVTREDFVDSSQEEGSLWASSGQTNYYFTKNKIRNPGDIISISIESELHQNILSEIKKTLNSKEEAIELKIAQDKDQAHSLTNSSKTDMNSKGGQPPAKPSLSSVQDSGTEVASEKNSTNLTIENLDISASVGLKIGDALTGEILRRFQNGNYEIRSIKKIPYSIGRSRVVHVSGVVKPNDLHEETDTVASGKIYDYRIQIAY